MKLLPFNPCNDPRVLRLLIHLVDRPEALFLFVYRHVFRQPPEFVLQNLGALPLDQLALQVENQLAEHFSWAVSPLVVKDALNSLRRKLKMNRHGVSRHGTAGKRTLAGSLPQPLHVHVTGLLRWAEDRVTRAFFELPESHAVFEKFFVKNEGLLRNRIRFLIGHPDEDLVDEIAQATWQTGVLMYDPKHQWTIKFVEKIAWRLLHEEWRRRRRWAPLAGLKGLAAGMEDEGDAGSGSMDIERVPAPESGDAAWLLPLALYETAIAELMRVPGPPLQRAMYLATALLDIKPETIVKRYRQMPLADFVDMLEVEYLGRSRLNQETVSRLFEPLRQDLGQPTSAGPAPHRTRRSGVRPPGLVRIEEHFTSRLFKRRTRAISDWAENAKRQLWKTAGRSGSTLFRALREEDPSWTGPRRQRAPRRSA